MAEQTGAASTRNHVHNCLARIFALAEIAVGVRPVNSNPVLRAYRAPADEDKHFNFFYPPEVLALLGNRAVPVRRVLYIARELLRRAERHALPFKWGGIDWADGTVSVMKQKGSRRLDVDDGRGG